MDIIMETIHLTLFFMALAAMMLFAFVSKALGLVILLCVWVTDRHFKDRCLGLYAGRREDCSVDYVIPEVVYGGENIDDGEVMDAEWEEIK